MKAFQVQSLSEMCCLYLTLFGQLIQKVFKVIFETNQCLIKDVASNDVFRVEMKGKSFALDPLEEEQITLFATKIHAEV